MKTDSAIYNFRLCDNCQTPYCFKSEKGKKLCGEYDPRFCINCTDHYIKSVLKMPDELISVKRLQMAGRRFLRIEYEEYQINIIKLISKTDNHESYSAARSVIGYINKVKKGNNRPAISQANI